MTQKSIFPETLCKQSTECKLSRERNLGKTGSYLNIRVAR